jgi:hypothetical protein
MKGFLKYLASIPAYIWYNWGEYVVKGLFPKSFERWFAADIKMIEDIELYLADREKQINDQFEEWSREFHAGNSAANWEGQSSDLEATSPQWNLFESRLREKDKELEAVSKAYTGLQRAVLSFLNDPTLVGQSGHTIFKKMADIIRKNVEAKYQSVWNVDELGTTLCEGPVVLDNVHAVAEQGKAYRKPVKAKKKTKKLKRSKN